MIHGFHTESYVMYIMDELDNLWASSVINIHSCAKLRTKTLPKLFGKNISCKLSFWCSNIFRHSTYIVTPYDIMQNSSLGRFSYFFGKIPVHPLDEQSFLIYYEFTNLHPKQPTNMQNVTTTFSHKVITRCFLSQFWIYLSDLLVLIEAVVCA